MFVVGGDAQDHEIGVPSYPEDDPRISDERLLEVLLEKQRHASYMTTQMSFNPRAIAGSIGRMRASGVTLPVHLGLPGVADLTDALLRELAPTMADPAADVVALHVFTFNQVERTVAWQRALLGSLSSSSRAGEA